MKRARTKGTSQRREFSIARALASFSGEDEAALCAFLEEMEKCRIEPGSPLLGWAIQRDPGACRYMVLTDRGEVLEAIAPTFREAGSELGRKLTELMMKGAAQA